MVSTFFVNKRNCQIQVRELARTHLHHAVLSHDEVRHYRLKFDICRKIEEGSPKKILEKKNFIPKKYVELRTFDVSIIDVHTELVQNSAYRRSSHRRKGPACHIIVKSYTLHFGNPSIHLVRMLRTNLGFLYGWRIRDKSIDGTTEYIFS
jgi:hypothetical protein